MKKTTFLVCYLLLTQALTSFTQDVIMHEYNLLTKELSILNFGTSNMNVEFDFTESHVGSATTAVTLNSLVPDGNFSRLNKIEREVSYPISTAVKIESKFNGQVECLCSGTIVSKKHVITAAHCFLEIGTSNFLSDSLAVYPAFNNGRRHEIFGEQVVTKAYFFADWNLDGNDFIILELDREIGKETGWQGIAFNNSDDALRDQVFHKYSYPCFEWGQADTFNGDTLYYSYGLYNRVDNFIGTEYVTNGWTGESGSSIFLTNANNENYVYGVGTWAHNMRHSRIDEREFFGMSKILEGYNSSTFEGPQEANINIYPNPARDYITVYTGLLQETIAVKIINQTGQLIQNFEVGNRETIFKIDTKDLPNGTYHLVLSAADGLATKRFIKQ